MLNTAFSLYIMLLIRTCFEVLIFFRLHSQLHCITELRDQEEDASQAILRGAMGHPPDASEVWLYLVFLDQSQYLMFLVSVMMLCVCTEFWWTAYYPMGWFWRWSVSVRPHSIPSNMNCSRRLENILSITFYRRRRPISLSVLHRWELRNTFRRLF